MRKTHLWISLIVGLFVWGFYFTHVFQTVRAGDTDGLVWWFLGALGVIVAGEVVVGALIGWLFRKRTRTLDEGPTLTAALKAGHVALMVLVGLVLTAAGGLAICAAIGWSPDLSAARVQVIGANILLALVVLAELIRAGLTLALAPRR